MNLKAYIEEVPDFPEPGIMFKDITPLLQVPDAFREAIEQMYLATKDLEINAIAALDSRGFIFGTALAIRRNLPFALMRKKGKLPGRIISVDYGLEYGQATLEAKTTSFLPGDRVLVVDDLLATGGTAKAACVLVEKLGARVAGCLFLVEISELNGREVLKDYSVRTVLKY